jgi:hypothetical protein
VEPVAQHPEEKVVPIRWRSTPEGEFNTRGQEKCWHCGDWKPEAWIEQHADKCEKNPANKPPTQE